jgi:hypothetical protein
VTSCHAILVHRYQMATRRHTILCCHCSCSCQVPREILTAYTERMFLSCVRETLRSQRCFEGCDVPFAQKYTEWYAAPRRPKTIANTKHLIVSVSFETYINCSLYIFRRASTLADPCPILCRCPGSRVTGGGLTNSICICI